MATSAQLRREILAGQWDEALCTLYGTEPAVLARQRQRYAAALEQFELYYGPGSGWPNGCSRPAEARPRSSQ